MSILLGMPMCANKFDVFAQQAGAFAPEGLKVAGAFHNISAMLLEGEHDVDCDAIICTNDAGARQSANELAQAIPGGRAVKGAGKLPDLGADHSAADHTEYKKRTETGRDWDSGDLRQRWES